MHLPDLHPQPNHSLLFVPGNKPTLFAKAVNSGAHSIIIDLEDAVQPSDKGLAREAAAAFFAQGGSALLRINSLNTPWAEADLQLCRVAGIKGVVLPKAEGQHCIAKVRSHLLPHTPILPLIESAAGLMNVRAIASEASVLRLIYGTVDFCLDLNMEGDGEELACYRAWLVLASRAARLLPPVDGVTLDLKDDVALNTSTRTAKRLGFGGKLCIHPSQVKTVNACFQPTASEISWANEVLRRAQSETGVFQFQGQMVDAPVIARAHRLMAMNQGTFTPPTPSATEY